MAKKDTNAPSKNFTTTITADEIIHKITSEGGKVMKENRIIFEFVQATCDQDAPLSNTSITTLGERFTLQSEELPAIEARLSSAQAGDRLPPGEYAALRKRRDNLVRKNAAIAAFWNPRTPEGLQIRTEAHEILKQMLNPVETLNRNGVVQLLMKDGRIVGQSVSWKATTEPKNSVYLSYTYRDAQRLGQALATIRECESHWFEGQGIAFKRPHDRSGKPQNTIFVGITPDLPAYTVVNRGNRVEFLPFTMPATRWQLGALMLMGHDIEIVMNDPANFDEHAFRQLVVDGFVKSQFINRFGKLVLPYEKAEFSAARYPSALDIFQEEEFTAEPTGFDF